MCPLDPMKETINISHNLDLKRNKKIIQVNTKEKERETEWLRERERERERDQSITKKALKEKKGEPKKFNLVYTCSSNFNNYKSS